MSPTEAPFEVQDPIDVGDISDQESGDCIEPAQGVVVEIGKVSVKRTVDKETKEFKFAQLDLVFTIGPLGVDGEGKMAGRKFFAWRHLNFPGILLSFSKEKYIDGNERQTSLDWWNKQSRFQTKQFFSALGYDPANIPQINDELIGELNGKQVKVNILRVQEEALVDGKRVKTGEFINQLKDFKAVE